MTVHKIAKQYHRLRNGVLKRALRSYLTDRVDELVQVLQHDVGLDSAPHVFAHLGQPAANGGQWSWLAHKRAWHALYMSNTYKDAIWLGAWVLLMDAYLLGRMARFSLQEPSAVGGVSVVYTGDVHAGMYVRFLRDYLHVSPSVCHPLKVNTDGTVERCVPINISCPPPP